MNCFLPYPDFAKSAACLDDKRLGKQRIECLQILRCLCGYSNGWKNHPAVKMWEGFHDGLLRYGRAICAEWTQRGFKDTCEDKMLKTFTDWANDKSGAPNLVAVMLFVTSGRPPWLGDEVFHRSHQSNLVRKDPAHYRQFFPDVPDDLPYVWPTKEARFFTAGEETAGYNTLT